MASLARPSLASVSRGDVLDLSRQRGEPEWLCERRLHAFEVWERTPMPTRTDEGWRRTDIARLALGALEAQEAGLELSPVPGAAVTRGAVFTDLAGGLRGHEALLREHLLATLRPEDGKFAALNAALFTSLALLYVPPGLSVELPLRAVQRQAGAGGAIFPRTLLLAGRGSRVLLVDEGAGAGDAQSLSAAAVEVVVEEGAQVLHAQLNRYGRGVSHLLSHRARLGRDSRYLDLVVATGSALTKASIETLLEGPGAESHVLGVVYGDGAQHFDHDTLQDHRAPHTASRLLFKAALAGRARSVYTGLLRMRGAAAHADASQTNRNLLLSRQAKADSIPKLEIEVNDVKCSHASATSSVDPEQVFYLASRGLEPADAVRMLVEGFLDEVLAQFPLPELRDEIGADLAGRIAGGAA